MIITIFLYFQVSATDPDCGVNAIVNYTLGEGIRKLSDFEIRSDTGEVCILGDLDYELRSSYEFPIIATDRGIFFYIRSLSSKNLKKFFSRWLEHNSNDQNTVDRRE